MTRNCFGQDEVDEKALLVLPASFALRARRATAAPSSTSTRLLLPESGKSWPRSKMMAGRRTTMIYSYTQTEPVFALSAELSLPLSRWMAGEGHPRQHDLRPVL